MNTVAVLVLAFFAGTIILARSSYERYLKIIFLIRTQYGIRIIDRLAKVRPGFTIFLTDMSVLLFYGGIGAYYLSRFRQTRKHLYISLATLGVGGLAAAGLMGKGMAVVALGLPILAVSLTLLKKAGDSRLDFLASSIIIGLIASLVFPPFLSTLAAFTSLPGILTYTLVTHGMAILGGGTDMPGVSPMVPTVDDSGTVGVGFPGINIFIPWWYAATALFVTLVAHEGAHGILFRIANVEVKSTGLLTFGAMPVGAFVEPDEEDLKKHPSPQRMRAMAAGSFANMIVAVVGALVLLGMNYSAASLVSSDGIKVVGLMEDYPAQEVMESGAVIYEINGVSTKTRPLFDEQAGSIKPGDTVKLNTSQGVMSLTAQENPDDPDKGYLGVYIVENIVFTGPVGEGGFRAMEFVMNSLIWIVFFNISISIVNLMPVLPFDGGRMFKEILELFDFSEVTVEKILYSIIAVTGVIFLVNMMPVFRLLRDFILHAIGV